MSGYFKNDWQQLLKSSASPCHWAYQVIKLNLLTAHFQYQWHKRHLINGQDKKKKKITQIIQRFK